MNAQGFRVYVAAPCPRAALVRELHVALRKVGCVPTSHWATLVRGADKLDEPGEVAMVLEMNRIGVEQAALVIALLFDREGGEMFVEAGHALWEGIPVLWCGDRKILSCHHPLSRLLPNPMHSSDTWAKVVQGLCPNWEHAKLVKLCASVATEAARLARLGVSIRSTDVLERIDAFDAPTMLRPDPQTGYSADRLGHR